MKPRIRRGLPLLALQQGCELAHDFRAALGRQTCRELRLPDSPIQALHLVRQDHASYRQIRRKRHFKRVTFGMTGNWTEKAKTDFAVVRTRRNDDSGTPPGLLVSSPRIQAYPDDVTTLRDIGHGATTLLGQRLARSQFPRGDSSSSLQQAVDAVSSAAGPASVALRPFRARPRFLRRVSSPPLPRRASESEPPNCFPIFAPWFSQRLRIYNESTKE